MWPWAQARLAAVIIRVVAMRTLGLIGGMSYHSTVDYYMGINNAVAAAVGGHASAPLLLSSVNFQEVRDRQVAGDWDGLGILLARHAQVLQTAGAEAIVICANLMHKVAPAVAAAIDVALIHIVDAVAEAAKARGLGSLGIMGTGWTMREAFYADRLAACGVRPVRAGEPDIALTDRIVFDELTQGIVTPASRTELLGVVDRLAAAGADGVVLGCTELPMILSPADTAIPLVDSVQAHVGAAVRFILGS